MAVYALCDGFINPRRSGGGSAIVHAMSAGLPCLSVAFGDAYDAVRNFPVIKTYHEMADVAARLVADEAFRLRYRQMAAEASQLLNSKAPLIARIMTEYAAFLDRRASPI
jgi:glycosyltransferase involved in cell wall biosynthesis